MYVTKKMLAEIIAVDSPAWMNAATITQRLNQAVNSKAGRKVRPSLVFAELHAMDSKIAAGYAGEMLATLSHKADKLDMIQGAFDELLLSSRWIKREALED